MNAANNQLQNFNSIKVRLKPLEDEKMGNVYRISIP